MKKKLLNVAQKKVRALTGFYGKTYLRVIPLYNDRMME